MTRDEIIGIFKSSGALLEGHFILRSGLRSRQFFQCALVLQEMPVVEKLGAALAEACAELEIDTVVAPAMGGLVIGQEVARQLRKRYLFVEKEEGKLVMKRGFVLRPSEKVMVVEDVITKGGRAQETIDIIRGLGGEVVAVASLVDRSNGQVSFGIPFKSLLSLEVETFSPDNLPEDLQKIPPVKPGSK